MQVATPAPRFTLNLPMRYRPVGHPLWRSVKTVNVSSSGLKFIATERLAAGAKLEVEISMTAELLKPTRLTAVSEVLRQGTDDQPLLTTVKHMSSQTVVGDLPE